MGKLLLQWVRERDFGNIRRSTDEARKLGNKKFAEILGFTPAAFEMAMTLHKCHTTRRRKVTTKDQCQRLETRFFVVSRKILLRSAGCRYYRP